MDMTSIVVRASITAMQTAPDLAVASRQVASSFPCLYRILLQSAKLAKRDFLQSGLQRLDWQPLSAPLSYIPMLFEYVFHMQVFGQDAGATSTLQDSETDGLFSIMKRCAPSSYTLHHM